jgi:hypothetical protein
MRCKISLCVAVFGLVIAAMPRASQAAFGDRWTWFTPDYAHYQAVEVPFDVPAANDLHVFLVHPPEGNNPPTAGGMPYTGYNSGTGQMSFGAGVTTYVPGDKVGVQFESKFDSDSATAYRWTLNGTAVGSTVDLTDARVGYNYNYDNTGHTMTVSVANLSTTTSASFSNLRLAHSVPDSYLTDAGGIASNAAYASGIPVSVGTVSGTLTPGQQMIIGSFALDDVNNVNNIGYILADGNYTFGGSSLEMAAGGFGTPEPTTLPLLAFGSLALRRRVKKI